MISSTQDIVQDVLKKSGEKTDGTSDYQSDALNYVDTFYRAILSGGNEFDVNLGEPWTWAKAKYPGVITLKPPIATEALLTLGSNAGVFTSAPTTSLINYLVKSDAGGEWYRITAHTAGNTAFTLDTTYNDATGTYAINCILLDYELDADNILRQIGPMKVYRTQTSEGDNEGKITGLDIRSFERKYPLYRITNGVPTEFAILFNDTANQKVTVRFNKYCDQATRVDYDYIPAPAGLTYSTASIPVIPIEFRQCLSYCAAYAILNDKEDSKSKTYADLARAKLQAMVNANRKEFMQISKNRGRLIARMDDYTVKNWPTSGW